MSVGVIVERSGDSAIAISGWRRIVDDDAELRWRTEPYTATNPRVSRSG
jgi:hypothetical protein